MTILQSLSRQRAVLCLFALALSAQAPAARSPVLQEDVKAGNLAALQKHLNQGADLGERDSNGVMPLHLAILLQKSDLALELIRRGANINARTPDGSTPLVLAVDKGQMEVVNLLLDRKAIIDAPVSGSSPLFGAVRTGNRELFERLVVAGAQVDRRDRDGKSPLYVAAAAGNVPLVQRLLELGADINAALPDHRTPIFAAIAEKKTDVAEVLYARGAAIDAAEGETGAFLTPLVYRFAAEQEYKQQQSTRSIDYLARAQVAFASAHTVLNAQAEQFSHQVDKTRLGNALLLVLGAAAAGIQAGTSLSGSGTQIVFLGGTASPKELRDKYRNLAEYCDREAQRMSTVQSCVIADGNFSHSCFSAPTK